MKTKKIEKKFLYDRKNKELNDEAIIVVIKSALNDYENGDILNARDSLLRVVNAIDEYEKNY